VRFFGTTQAQVAAVVAGSVLLAHFLSIMIVSLLLHSGQPEAVPTIGRGVSTLLGELYDSEPAIRPAVLESAARAGIRLRPLAPFESSDCSVVERAPGEFDRHPLPPGTPPRARAKIAICSPALADGVQTAFQTVGGSWLGVIDSSRNIPPPRRPPERPHFWLVGILAITVGTTVMICVWASRRVTAPLLRLAEAAEQVDIEHGGTVPQTSGTREIRLLADAFNGLILRLRSYATKQRQLVAGVSHDLRTPLTRIRLRLDQVTDPALRERLVRDVQTMQLVVDSSLSLIRAEEGGAQKCDVDIGALLSTIVDNFTDSGADVDFSGPLHLKLHCDPALMTRAVENVVDNALKFAGRAEVVLRTEPSGAVIEVSDDGPGISDDQKKLVFEAFYRGDDSRGVTEGSGLGLAITKALVQAHGGSVDLLDAKPNGLTVRMLLPA
jgi:signal transduction histidine kinase